MLSSTPCLSLSLSFFLSLSQALGKPKPRVGFGFPLVFSASRPRTSSSTRTPWSSTSPRLRPAPVFFFFSSLDRRLGVFLVSCLVGVGGHGGCLLWSVMVRCLRFLSRPSGVFFFLLGWWGSPCCVSPVVSPWFLGGRGCVFVLPFLASSISSCI